MEFTQSKTQQMLNDEWDLIAEQRDFDILNKVDISYHRILLPLILKKIGTHENILDIGCGTGHLTMMAKASYPNIRITGIDPSPKSIKIATTRYPDITFINTPIEKFSPNTEENFDFICSNMVLMDAINLSTFVKKMYDMSDNKKTFSTLTHPSFWPRYWGYDKLAGFNYSNETWIESNFKTARHKYDSLTTHIHRPLEMYIAAFKKAGFRDISIAEVRGPENIEQFPYPRFLTIETR